MGSTDTNTSVADWLAGLDDEPDQVTACCGAYPTYSSALGEPVLCCRACYQEVSHDGLVDKA